MKALKHRRRGVAPAGRVIPFFWKKTENLNLAAWDEKTPAGRLSFVPDFFPFVPEFGRFGSFPENSSD
jgi:hypothetical protein